ncbi:lysophospholipid acyltransferase family protein [Chachezhania sediminis]|uniref:lysophospholipid acyltransferase family protein n=1 Tax=Chachezhania sediminis TaxID=2599291 RepID=UPI00131CDEB5|nr:DUF374 domain-containing protein [Chachezhania sediminis]
MSLRKKIANSAALNNAVEWLVAGYLRLAQATSRWERVGYEEMDRAGENGEPIIGVLWHQRIMAAPWLCDLSRHRMCTLTADARAGRLAGNVQAKLGMENISMSSHKRHVALTRTVIEKMREGCSIGIACDGPRGPARVSSTVPIIWARTTGSRVFMVAFSARKVFVAGSWDKMFLPLPFSRGVMMCREWTETVPRRASAEDIEVYRQKLQDALNDLTAEADRYVGRVPEELPTP